MRPSTEAKLDVAKTKAGMMQCFQTDSNCVGKFLTCSSVYWLRLSWRALFFQKSALTNRFSLLKTAKLESEQFFCGFIRSGFCHNNQHAAI